MTPGIVRAYYCSGVKLFLHKWFSRNMCSGRDSIRRGMDFFAGS